MLRIALIDKNMKAMPKLIEETRKVQIRKQGDS